VWICTPFGNPQAGPAPGGAVAGALWPVPENGASLLEQTKRFGEPPHGAAQRPAGPRDCATRYATRD
jgi:hypothetical protein